MFAIGFLLSLSSVVGQQYCSSGPTSYYDTNLGPVTLAGDSGTSITETNDCPKRLGVFDLTTLSADLTAGRAYTLRYSVTSCGSYYTSLVGAWIDYNNNKIYEPTEMLFPFVSHSNGANGAQDFIVPAGVTYLGQTRLRVQLQETASSALDPCLNFSYGGTKDFTVNLKASNPYCTCGPTSNEDTHLGPHISSGDIDIVQGNESCPGQLGPVNYTNTRLTVTQGGTYTMAMSVVTCNKPYPNIQSSIWFDFNADNRFTEDERILQPSNRFGAIFVTYTVPADAVPGPTSYRVMVQEILNGASESATIGPCDNFLYGGTQDYPATIRAAAKAGGMAYRE